MRLLDLARVFVDIRIRHPSNWQIDNGAGRPAPPYFFASASSKTRRPIPVSSRLVSRWLAAVKLQTPLSQQCFVDRSRGGRGRTGLQMRDWCAHPCTAPWILDFAPCPFLSSSAAAVVLARLMPIRQFRLPICPAKMVGQARYAAPNTKTSTCSLATCAAISSQAVQVPDLRTPATLPLTVIVLVG